MKKSLFFLTLIIFVFSTWSNTSINSNNYLNDKGDLDTLPPLVTPSTGGDLDNIPPLVNPIDNEDGDGLDDLIPLNTPKRS
ncbi:MAG: hypothetical protein M0R46_01140 [Candidatus Muirbacterium halophilum]|nr:hypothetical protein [Candidatus Muirbacterium halophilum]